jgi:hypothetical protein
MEERFTIRRDLDGLPSLAAYYDEDTEPGCIRLALADRSVSEPDAVAAILSVLEGVDPAIRQRVLHHVDRITRARSPQEMAGVIALIDVLERSPAQA